MRFIRDKLTYEEVRGRFEKEGYRLLSAEYRNAKSNLRVLCSRGHEWRTNISNFDFGRRCSTCSRKKKYTLDEVKCIFSKVGYKVQDSKYMNGKTPIKVTCDNGHETAISLNNFVNGRRCGFCRWINFRKARMKKLEMMAKSEQGLPRREVSCSISVSSKLSIVSDGLVRQEWLTKMDELRKSLRSTKRRTYQEQ